MSLKLNADWEKEIKVVTLLPSRLFLTCILFCYFRCLKELLELIEALTEHKEISIGENISEESENVQNLEEPLRVRGCVMSMVERMDEEFTKMLQGCDCHSTEYVERYVAEHSGKSGGRESKRFLGRHGIEAKAHWLVIYANVCVYTQTFALTQPP